MQSDFCVTHTCLGALAHGYAVTLVSDAHTTFSGLFSPAERIVERVNRTLAAKGAALRPAAEALG